MYLGVEFKLLDEDVPLTHEGNHLAIWAEGRYHHLALILTEGLDAIASYVVVVSVAFPRAAVDGLSVGDQEDVMPLRLEEVVVEALELTVPSPINTEQGVDELPRGEAIPEDRPMPRIHHRVVQAIAHGAHTSPCRTSREYASIDLLDRHNTGAILSRETSYPKAKGKKRER